MGGARPLDRATQRIIDAVRPKTATLGGEDGVSSSQLVHYLLGKGLTAAVRGSVRFPLRALRGRPIFVGRSTRIIFGAHLTAGKGVFIGDFSFVNCLGTGGVRLGDRVTIRERAWVQVSSSPYRLGSHLTIGEDTYIGPGAILGAAGPLVIGRRTQIGANLMASAENHDYRSGTTVFDQTVSREGITIGDDCWIGNGVCILDGVTIGDRAVIGAGSVVTRDVAAGAVVAGVPAKQVVTSRPTPDRSGSSSDHQAGERPC